MRKKASWSGQLGKMGTYFSTKKLVKYLVWKKKRVGVGRHFQQSGKICINTEETGMGTNWRVMQHLWTVPRIKVDFKISSVYRSVSHEYRAKGVDMCMIRLRLMKYSKMIYM